MKIFVGLLFLFLILCVFFSRNQDKNLLLQAYSISDQSKTLASLKQDEVSQEPILQKFVSPKPPYSTEKTLEEVDFEIKELTDQMENENIIERLDHVNTNQELVEEWRPIFEKLTRLRQLKVEIEIAKLDEDVRKLESEHLK